jgi:hypothetical protein
VVAAYFSKGDTDMRTIPSKIDRPHPPERPPATRTILPTAQPLFGSITESFEVRNGNILVFLPLPYREKILTGLLDLAEHVFECLLAAAAVSVSGITLLKELSNVDAAR